MKEIVRHLADLIRQKQALIHQIHEAERNVVDHAERIGLLEGVHRGQQKQFSSGGIVVTITRTPYEIYCVAIAEPAACQEVE